MGWMRADSRDSRDSRDSSMTRSIPVIAASVA
jgi:hypothetical protein